MSKLLYAWSFSSFINRPIIPGNVECLSGGHSTLACTSLHENHSSLSSIYISKRFPIDGNSSCSRHNPTLPYLLKNRQHQLAARSFRILSSIDSLYLADWTC